MNPRVGQRSLWGLLWLAGLGFPWGVVGAGPADSAGSAVLPPGLVLHLAPVDHREGEGSDAVDGDRGALSLWPDLSGRGNHLRVPPGRPGPVLGTGGQGGRGVRFDGGGSLELGRVEGLHAGEQPFHLVVVVRGESGPGRSGRWVDLPSVGTDPELTRAYTGKRTGFWIGSQPFEDAWDRVRVGVHVGDEGEGGIPVLDGRPHLVEVIYPGRQRWSLFVDGVRAGRGRFGSDRTFLGFDGGVKLALGLPYGAAQGTNGFRGEFFELLLFDRPLRAAEQTELRGRLAKRHPTVALASSGGDPVPHYGSDVEPVFRRHCVECHGARLAENRLRLDTPEGLARGGQGGDAIVAGDSARSLVFHVIESGEMPPPGSKSRPTEAEVDAIRRWIEESATELPPVASAPVTRSTHWAFQPLRRPGVPQVSGGNQVRSEMDAFILAGLGSRGMGYGPEASRETLMRRVCLDVTGLPPTPAEVDAFLADGRADAFERMVDRQLASPHFGERWGRHWLDAAGYTDTYALDNDAGIIKPGPGKWRFRDYVVQAFNDDLPFDEFLVAQLAGDERVDWRGMGDWDPGVREGLVATGFLRCAADYTDENELNTLQVRYDILQRTVESVANNLLGLTWSCARCHDHKYEPISQRDYYRFAAIFSPALNPHAWLQPGARQLVAMPPSRKAALDREWREAQAGLQELHRAVTNRVRDARLAGVPAAIRDDVREALARSAAERSEIQTYLAKRFETVLKPSLDDVRAAMTEEERRREGGWNAVTNRIAGLYAEAGMIQAVYDAGPPSPLFILRRGNYETPGGEVPPGLPSVLASTVALAGDPGVAGRSSGRRLALARRLTDWESAPGSLVARVRANRIWQQLFGVGLVEASDNLGVSGPAPADPALLEWLASEFVAGRGRLKPFLRTILTSGVYRQSSEPTPAGLAADPANRWLGRQRLRRLESEAIRDSLLAVSGRLDPAIGGPPVPIVSRPDGSVVEAGGAVTNGAAGWRRSLYVLGRRNYNLSLLSVFDQPLMNTHCIRRSTSAVVLQTLTLLHDAFVATLADSLAARVFGELPTAEDRDRLRRAFRWVLVRQPEDGELAAAEAVHGRMVEAELREGHPPVAARRRALAVYCRMLFNTSEFLYVE